MSENRSLGHRLNIVGRLFARRLNEKIIFTGLTTPQWSIVNRLLRHGELTQAEICEQLSLEPSTVSKTLWAMEQAGWISRIVDNGDKREKRATLTAKARTGLPVWLKSVAELQDEALRGLSQEDIDTFDRVLDHIRDNLREHETKRGTQHASN